MWYYRIVISSALGLMFATLWLPHISDVAMFVALALIIQAELSITPASPTMAGDSNEGEGS